MKTIGIVGSRRRDSEKDLRFVKEAFLKVFEEGDIICSGGCPKGGDKFAELLAKIYNIPIKLFPANWSKYGKAAGFVRNTDIAQQSDILIACVAEDRTGGTEDTIKKFLKLGKKNLIVV